MIRYLARSVSVVGVCAFAVGCTPQQSVQGPPQVTDPTVESSGSAGLCDFGSTGGGGTGVFPTPPGLPSSATTPQPGSTVTATTAPPAISGGTLRILPDGTTAIAADPDRDQIYVVDLATRTVTFTIALQPGDEPGRVAVDAAGRAHVALRRGGALVTISPTTGTILARRSVCAAPRGVAYDPTGDLVHVACADGQLVSLPAAGGAATRSLQLDNDLRDVIVDGNQLYVTRFRTAELLTLDSSGTVQNRVTPPPFRAPTTRGDELFTASTAWRAEEMPTGGVVMVHQRGLMDEVMPTAGGYGSQFGNGECDSIVQTAVTVVAPGQDPQSGPAMAGMVVPADMAVSSDGSRVAIISAGNATNSDTEGGPPRMPRVFVTSTTDATDPTVGCSSDGVHGPCLPLAGFVGGEAGGPPFVTSGAAGTSGNDGTVGTAGTTGFAGSSGTDGLGGVSGGAAGASGGLAGTPGQATTVVPNTCNSSTDSGSSSDPTVPQVVGQPIAVSFMGNGNVVVQSREPAVLSLPGGAPISLSTVSRADTGHIVFHSNAGSGIACASCHAEGTEDGRTWTFACEGSRRTQPLQVGLNPAGPFHWGGDEKDFPTLMTDVFVGRMSGPPLASDQVTATFNWLNNQPRRTHTMPTDTAAIARGQALFNDTAHAGCVTCHNGPSLTNNQIVDVGTGGNFKVPSLVGISTRGPFLHNGCAATLRDRFGTCGGGDKHGQTSKLSSGQIDDLITYLDTL
jgi:hypothetical protein